ncbi:MAG: hypothetical protein IKD18_04595, partial [Clostridia bacterium]|nr:hypothetical protein [Clostridia bacterium]
SFVEPKQVEILTLTSSFDPVTVPKFTLYAADNDGEWVELCSRENVAFEWAQYTRPFLTGATKAYNHYKLVFEKATIIAEIEMLGK